MSEVDSKQIGGRHYKGTEYQHWNLVINTGLDYLAGNATKYLARHKKAGKPAQDLEKAKHYVEKLLESAGMVSSVRRFSRSWIKQEVDRFCRANNIEGRESYVFFLLCTWHSEADLIKVRDAIVEWLGMVDPQVVPLEDSNKHASRAER